VDAICRAIDANAGRNELIEHLALRHIGALQELDLADDSIARITGLALSVLRRVHDACVAQDDPSEDRGPDRRA